MIPVLFLHINRMTMICSIIVVWCVVGDTVIGLEDNNGMCCHLLPALCLWESHLDYKGKTWSISSSVHELCSQPAWHGRRHCHWTLQFASWQVLHLLQMSLLLSALTTQAFHLLHGELMSVRQRLSGGTTQTTVTDCASQPAERRSFPCQWRTLYTAYTVCVSYEQYYLYGQLHVAALHGLLTHTLHLYPYPYGTCLKQLPMQRSDVGVMTDW